MACTVCSGSDSNPNNFLLHCSSCATNYHHLCHNPALETHNLLALVKASINVRKGSKDPRDIAHNLQTWQCTACASIQTDVAIVKPPLEPTVIDLISDSDDEQPIRLGQKKQAEAPRDSESGPVQIEQRVVRDEHVKTEESATLPPAKYNLAPNWISMQHSKSQTMDSWDRLAKRKPACHNRKLARPVIKRAQSQPFVLSASLWLKSQRSTLPV